MGVPMANLFKDILPDLNFGHKNLIRTGEMDEAQYIKQRFLINRSLSMSPDTVMYANDMNELYDLDGMLQYDYFINSIRKKKRYNKWAKASKTSSKIDIIKEYYNYNEQRAVEVLPLLSKEHLDFIRSKMDKGGNDGVPKQTRKNK
jgi:hypothetical protein